MSNGCVKQIKDLPHICSPLLVVENSVGKKRLVISLNYLNLYFWKSRFKYEDLEEYFEKDAFMFTFDLKSGYHHIDIHPDYQTYLGFAWESKFYVFTFCRFVCQRLVTSLLKSCDQWLCM